MWEEGLGGMCVRKVWEGCEGGGFGRDVGRRLWKGCEGGGM